MKNDMWFSSVRSLSLVFINSLTRMHKYILFLAAILGAVGVAMGAFGAHGLEGKLSSSQLATWETAVKYQLFHVLAILVVMLFYQESQASLLKKWSHFFSGRHLPFLRLFILTQYERAAQPRQL